MALWAEKIANNAKTVMVLRAHLVNGRFSGPYRLEDFVEDSHESSTSDERDDPGLVFQEQNVSLSPRQTSALTPADTMSVINISSDKNLSSVSVNSEPMDVLLIDNTLEQSQSSPVVPYSLFQPPRSSTPNGLGMASPVPSSDASTTTEDGCERFNQLFTASPSMSSSEPRTPLRESSFHASESSRLRTPVDDYYESHQSAEQAVAIAAGQAIPNDPANESIDSSFSSEGSLDLRDGYKADISCSERIDWSSSSAGYKADRSSSESRCFVSPPSSDDEVTNESKDNKTAEETDEVEEVEEDEEVRTGI